MRFLHMLVMATALLGATGPLAGCPKSTGPVVDVATLETDPKANFDDGIRILQTPDRKTGAIDYQTAYLRFAKSVELGGPPKAAFNAAWVAEVLGNPSDAEIFYGKAFQADPTYTAAMFSLARLYNQTGKGAMAVDLYKGFLASNPDDLEVRNDLIVSLTAAKRYDEALAEGQTILMRDPKNVAAYRNLSAMYQAKGQIAMAALFNEKALQLNDTDAGIYNNLAVTDLAIGNEPEAIERLKTAVQLNSKHFEANTNLGYIALNSGDYALAKTSLEAAVTADPKNREASLGLAVALRGSKEYDRAGALYDQLIGANKCWKPAYENASVLHEVYTKDFTKALKYLQDYVDGCPGSVSPDDEIFKRMERVKAAKVAEEQRKAAEAEKKRLEEERKKRNEALLGELKTITDGYKSKFEANSACMAEKDAMVVEEGLMVLEQAGMVVEAQDVDMVADIKMMLDGYTGTWDELIGACAGGAAPAAPAPAEPAPTP